MTEATSNAPAIVDAHVHLLPERLGAAIRRFFPAATTGALLYPHEPGAARAAIAAAGVQRCWSLPYARKPGAAAALNRWMAESFAGDTLVVGGATVHPGDDVESVLRDALDQLNLQVLKLHCSVGDYQPDDPRLDALWRRVSDSGHPVVVHAGHASDGTTSAADVAAIGRVAEHWPRARIIIAHCGAPAVAATIALLRRHPSLYADLTPVLPALTPLHRESLHGIEQRLLFGSDAPNVAVRIEDSIAHIQALGLAPSDQAAVLGGTAQRLLARH
jgi:predicted TIM-barrel fold metal-dependent hydrolase